MLSLKQRSPEAYYMPPFCVGGNCITTHSVVGAHLIFTSPPEGVARYCFHPVCLCVCVFVCQANILVFYFSIIRRDIDLKFIQDTYMVVLNSLK